jgi:plasmid stabilization system protein ParE
MLRLARLSPEAKTWLEAEVRYLASRSPAAARKLLTRLRAKRRPLAEHPNIGPVGLFPGTRLVFVPPFVSTVRLRSDVVEIAGVRHAKQEDARAPKHLRGDPNEVEPSDDGSK